MSDLLGAILNLATDTVTVTRRTGGSFTAGKWTPGTPSTFTAVGSMQPARDLNRVIAGSDLLSSEFGDSVSDVRVFYTATELRVRGPNNDPDSVAFEGRDYTVARVELWDNVDETYFRVVLTRQNAGAS